MTTKERLAAAAIAAAAGAVAPTVNLGEIELQEGYTFDGKDIPDKFVYETADALFSIATDRCGDDAEKMLEMLNAGAFQLATDKESGKPFTTSEGKLVYSVPFKSNRIATGIKPGSASVSISQRTSTTDKYKDILITVVAKPLPGR